MVSNASDTCKDLKQVKHGDILLVTLVRSLIGRKKSHQACVRGIGLRKINQTVEVCVNQASLGMLKEALYLLRVEKKK